MFPFFPFWKHQKTNSFLFFRWFKKGTLGENELTILAFSLRYEPFVFVILIYTE